MIIIIIIRYNQIVQYHYTVISITEHQPFLKKSVKLQRMCAIGVTAIPLVLTVVGICLQSRDDAALVVSLL